MNDLRFNLVIQLKNTGLILCNLSLSESENPVPLRKPDKGILRQQ